MRILAIETSCDETAIAIADFSGSKTKPRIKILSNLISSQVKIHQKFGGVVPNLAKREHQKNLVPLLIKALKERGMWKVERRQQKQPSTIHTLYSILEREPELLLQFQKRIIPLAPPKIDAIAVTYGPGLAPALWVGVNFAKALSALWNIPLIPVDHMAGHLYSALLESREKALHSIRFPALALLVSGGHTELVLMRGHGKYKILGETRDDAAGEAFDKVARLLGFPYPGGPAISALAEMKLKSKNEKVKITLPRPMMNSNDYDFSFSGLKTAVLYEVRDLTKRHPLSRIRPVIAREFQNAVVDVLVKKTIRAAKEYEAKTVLLGGGVAANQLLRIKLKEALHKEIPDSQFLIPDSRLTGDNALMIAIAAYFTGKKEPWQKIEAKPNLRLSL